MRIQFFGLILFLGLNSFSQGADTTITAEIASRKVSFIAKINLQQATKDGMYLNGYVVNLPYKKAEQLNGKTVRIKGKVTIVKGIKYNVNGEVRQGRALDAGHILKPKIKIMSD